ncbi:MAG: hypothetical protein NZ738_05610, partial [Oceanospirillaceae bacterium]|nr:hypothetical protein [Oceanospirillaceae bacterium]
TFTRPIISELTLAAAKPCSKTFSNASPAKNWGQSTFSAPNWGQSTFLTTRSTKKAKVLLWPFLYAIILLVT